MAKKKRQPDDDLGKAKQDIKKLVREHQGTKQQVQKNIPYKILMGMKKKQAVRAQKEEDANREAQVQYNSFVFGKTGSNPLRPGAPKLFTGSGKGGEAVEAPREKKVEKKKAFDFRDGVLNVSKGMLQRLGAKATR
jgi:hypothetical protein